MAAKKISKTAEKRGMLSGDREIGKRLRIARLERNMSQMKLADTLGVSFQQVQKYEKGTNRLSGGRIMLIAETLNTTPHELMGWKSNSGTNGTLVDAETYKLAKAFQPLPDRWKPLIRRLIADVMRGE